MATIASTRAIPRAATQTTDMTGMQRMASKMWAPWIIMGLMIVGVSFIIALFVQSDQGFWWSFPKVERDAAAAGSDIVGAKAFIESTQAWLPGFKFLGLGMMLGGITFLLATILGNLRAGGAAVQRSLGAAVQYPKTPLTATLFPMLMMMGTMVLIAALAISVYLGVEAHDLWSNSIATIDSAPAGSSILAQLGRIAAVKAWLAPFKFVGMALLFSGIALALVTIVTILRWQSRRLVELVDSK